MRKKGLLAVLTAAGAMAAIPAGTATASSCAVNAGDAGEVCVTVQVGCIIGSIKGQQYFAPCVRVERRP